MYWLGADRDAYMVEKSVGSWLFGVYTYVCVLCLCICCVYIYEKRQQLIIHSICTCVTTHTHTHTPHINTYHLDHATYHIHTQPWYFDLSHPHPFYTHTHIRHTHTHTQKKFSEFICTFWTLNAGYIYIYIYTHTHIHTHACTCVCGYLPSRQGHIFWNMQLTKKWGSQWWPQQIISRAGS